MKTAAASVMSASAFGAADMEQDEEDQRVLEEIVAEGREELAPEQGREAPRHQQRRGHGSPAGSKWARDPDRATNTERLRNDNWGKRTIAQRGGGTPVRETNLLQAKKRSALRLGALDKKMRAARGRPPLRSRHMRCRYRRRSCCPPRSIITAATPRQTAAPHASVNSAIHMASSPMSPQSYVEWPTNSVAANPFRELCPARGNIEPFSGKICFHRRRSQPLLEPSRCLRAPVHLAGGQF